MTAVRALLLSFACFVATACSQPGMTRAEVSGENLYLLGTFDHGTYKLVLDLLDAHPEVRTLVFTANGGSVDDECVLDLGRELRRRGIDTHVADRGVLASGGLSLFLAGNRRTVG